MRTIGRWGIAAPGCHGAQQRRHHDKNPAGLTELVRPLPLRAELESHLQKESRSFR
jgi:hypothetical protein